MLNAFKAAMNNRRTIISEFFFLRFLVNKGGRSGSVRFSRKMTCKAGQNRDGFFRTNLQMLSTKQQISVGRRSRRPDENMFLAYDTRRGRMHVTSLKHNTDTAWWNVNVRKHARCIGISWSRNDASCSSSIKKKQKQKTLDTSVISLLFANAAHRFRSK